MTTPEQRLIELLQTRQQQLGISDIPFAKEIGISQGHWSHIKRTTRHIGHRMATSILKRFPELWREVHDAMFPREAAAEE